MASETDTHTPNSFVVIFGTVATLFFVAALFIASIAKGGKGDDVDARRAQQRRETRQKLEQAEHETLNSAGWVDKAKGIARLPIADAMKSTVAELQNKKAVASSVKVEPALPMPPPYDPNAAEPAPLPLPSAPQGADTMRFQLAAASPIAAPAAAVPATGNGQAPSSTLAAPQPASPTSAVPLPPPATSPPAPAPPAPAQPAPAPPAAAPVAPAPPGETTAPQAPGADAPARPPLITPPQQTSETPQ